MTKLSPARQETARNNERLILRRLAAVTQKGLADALDWSESKISRMKDGDLESLCMALAALDLKIVPKDAHMVSDAEYRFIAEKMAQHYQAIIEKA